MMKLIATLLCATISFNVNAQTHWERPRHVDIQHIALNLRFDWSKKQAAGTATIRLSPIQPLDHFTLDAAKLTINSIKLGDSQLNYTYNGSDADDALNIQLPKTFQRSEIITITIDYHTNHVNAIDPNSLSGSNGKGLRFSQSTYNDPVKPKEVWSMADPQSNRYWFPCYDSPGDWRTTELIATVDKDLTVISNGIQFTDKANNDGTHSVHWKMDTPYANHLTTVVVGPYTDVTQSSEGVSLHSYGYHRERDAIEASVERLPDMVKFISEKTGMKYPYSRYSQVFVQDIPWGIGNAMVATQSENMVDDKGTHDDFLYLWDGLEGETLANQWFGSMVTFADWNDVWLGKAFAHYFDGLYSEYKNGKEEFQLWHRMGGDQAAYFWEWNAGVRRSIVTRTFESPAAFLYNDSHSTTRGALVLHMLRKHIGEDNWWRGIQRYLKKNAGQPVTTDDFRQAMAEVTGQPLDWFFDQWVYGMGHPVFEIKKSFSNKKLSITIQQDTAKFFQGYLDIEVDDRIERVWLKSQKENVFTFDQQTEPKVVNVDYAGDWIVEVKFEKTREELINQLKYSRDVYSRRSAMLALAGMGKDESTYAALRELIQSNTYWRLRQQALGQLQTLMGTPDAITTAMLLKVIKSDRSWTKAAALSFLGASKNPRYASIYLEALKDPSDRVVNIAAIALARSKSPKAFDALVKLPSRPSWKNQSLMSALVGLRELGDPRGYDVAFNALKDLELLRWRLPTPPVWDLRVFAVETIRSLGKSSDVYPLLKERFDRSVKDDDLEGIFNNTLLIAKLGAPRGKEIFDSLRTKYAGNADALAAIEMYEADFNKTVAK